MAIETTFGYNPQDYNMESGKALGEARRAQGEANRGLEGSTDWLAFAKGAVGVTQQYNKYNALQKQQLKSVDSNRAKIVTDKLVMSEEYRLAPAQGRVQMWQQLQTQGIKEESDAYNNAFNGYMKTPYITEYDKQTEDVTNSGLNTAHSLFISEGDTPSDVPKTDTNGVAIVDDEGKPVYKTKSEVFGNQWATEFTKQYIKDNPLASAEQVRNALSKGILAKHTTEILGADTPAALATILEEQNAELVPFENKQFLRTEGEDGAKAVTAGKKAIDDALKAKEAQFLKEAKGRVATQITSYENAKVRGKPITKEVLADLQYVSKGDPRKFKKEVDAMYKAHKENADSVTFFQHVDVSEPRDKQFVVTSNWIKDEVLQGEIYTVGSKAYDDNDTKTLLGTIQYNDPKNLKALGEYIIQDFNQAETEEDLTASLSKFMTIASKPGGSSNLRKLISDETFTEMMSIQGLTVSMYKNDVKGARDFYRQQAQNPTKNEFTRELKNKMGRRATQLGDNFNKYNTVMTNLNNISPALAKQQEHVVTAYFEKAFTTVDTLEGEIKINTADGPDVITNGTLAGGNRDNAADPEFAWGLVNKLASKFFPDGQYSIATTPNGMIQVKDPWGAGKFTINPRGIIDITNKKTLVEQQAALDGIPVGDLIISNSGKIARGLRESVGTLLTKFGTHVVENDPEFFSFLDSMFDVIGDSAGYLFSTGSIDDQINPKPEEKPKDPYEGYEVKEN